MMTTFQAEVNMETMQPTDNLEKVTRDWVKVVTGKEHSAISTLMSSSDWSKVEAAIEAGIEEANTMAVSNVARIKKFKVLAKDFSVDGGELSPTLKLKRSVVTQMYHEQIEDMYK